MNEDRERGGEAADVHPDPPLAPRRQQHPAEHGEAVEDGEQDRRGAHVAADQRQPEDGADHEDRDHRDDRGQRQQRLAPAVLPREEQPDRQADDDRLAQRVAEVLQRPVRRLLGLAPPVDGLGEVGGAVERVQRVAGHVPVERRPEQRGEADQAGVDRAAAVVERRPQPEPVEPAEHPRLRPDQPRERKQRQHRGAAPALRAPRAAPPPRSAARTRRPGSRGARRAPGPAASARPAQRPPRPSG